MSIAIQGQYGSFHHEAAKIMSGEVSPLIVPCNTFKDVFSAVQSGESPFGLVAIENNLHGAINEVYRLFRDYDSAWIIKELRMHIGQNLIGHEAMGLETLREKSDRVTIISHAVALEQVRGWIDENLPDARIEDYRDTAASVERVVREKDPNLFAVAGKIACDTYGGEIVAEEIQDDPDNYTRFVLFQNGDQKVEGAVDGSMILTADNKKGALLKALLAFYLMGCNLTKLDSHPIPGDQQHYDFYVDYELPKNNRRLISMLKFMGFSVRNLGEYVRIQ